MATLRVYWDYLVASYWNMCTFSRPYNKLVLKPTFQDRAMSPHSSAKLLNANIWMTVTIIININKITKNILQNVTWLEQILTTHIEILAQLYSRLEYMKRNEEWQWLLLHRRCLMARGSPTASRPETWSQCTTPKFRSQLHQQHRRKIEKQISEPKHKNRPTFTTSLQPVHYIH